MRVKFRFCRGSSFISPGWKLFNCSADTVFTSDAEASTLTLSVTCPSSSEFVSLACCPAERTISATVSVLNPAASIRNVYEAGGTKGTHIRRHSRIPES